MKFRISQSLPAVDYPAGRKDVVERRLETLEFYKISIGDFVSKGHRGIVFSGFINPPDYFSSPVKVAIKFARSDVPKENFILKEAEILEYLSNRNVVPKVYYFDAEILVMEFLDGESYTTAKFYEREDFKTILFRIIEACFLLDEMGVEHRELKGEDHIIVANRGVKFIDFESAKYTENPRNLLQFLGSHILNLSQDFINHLNIDSKKLKTGIELYKESRKAGLDEILKAVR